MTEEQWYGSKEHLNTEQSYEDYVKEMIQDD